MKPANIISIGGKKINWDNVAYVDTCATWRGGDKEYVGVKVHFVGLKCLMLQDDDAIDILEWLDAKEIPY